MAPLVTIVVAAAVSPPQLLSVMLAPGSIVVTVISLVVMVAVLWGAVALMRGRVRLVDGAVTAAGTSVLFLLVLMTLEGQPVVSMILAMSLLVLAAHAVLALAESLRPGTRRDRPAPRTS